MKKQDLDVIEQYLAGTLSEEKVKAFVNFTVDSKDYKKYRPRN